MHIAGGHLEWSDHTPAPPEDGLWLAASVEDVAAGTTVLDAGCGAGLAALALLKHQPHLHVCGVEVNPALVAAANAHAAHNRLPLTTVCANWLHYTHPTAARVIISNPPFWEGATHTPATHAQRNQALHSPAGQLSSWLQQVLHNLAPGGTAYLLLHSQQQELLAAFAHSQQVALTVVPLATHPANPPKRLLVRLHKGSKALLELKAPLPAHHTTLRQQVLERLERVHIYT